MKQEIFFLLFIFIIFFNTHAMEIDVENSERKDSESLIQEKRKSPKLTRCQATKKIAILTLWRAIPYIPLAFRIYFLFTIGREDQSLTTHGAYNHTVGTPSNTEDCSYSLELDSDGRNYIQEFCTPTVRDNLDIIRLPALIANLISAFPLEEADTFMHFINS